MSIILRTHLVSVGRKSRYIPMSLNHRLHWATRSRWNQAFKEDIQYEIMRNRPEIRKLVAGRRGKAGVNVKFYVCGQYLDLDNAYTAAKPLIDALKGEVIEDDHPDKCSIQVLQEKVEHKKQQHVEIEIYA